jgi:aminopeptidase
VTAVALDRFADLAVEVGANVQPGQVVSVSASLGQEELARAVAVSAYKRGAKFVDVARFDPYLKRARVQLADAETLDFVPPWYGERARELGRMHAARISLAGPVDPAALEGLDPERVGRDPLPAVREWLAVLNQHTVNWTIIPCPTVDWARLCYPDSDDGASLDRLSAEVTHVCRLDEADPAAAWRDRSEELKEAAERLNDLSLDALHFEGPGTDLTIGLLPSSRWAGAAATTVDGLEYMPNLPTEEVFTAPDPERADGHIRSTRPLVLLDGTIVRGLEVRFEGGRAVQIDAEEGAEVLRGRAREDEGASRLGEVALVDGKSRIGQLGTVFYETLLDENATSHIALGDGFLETIDPTDADRLNRSGIHIDFMIGGDDVDVTGIGPDGRRIPVLRHGEWQI